MDKEESKETKDYKDCCKDWKGMHHHKHHGAGGGALYGLGIFGAAIYYFQHAVTSSDYILGFIKAILWPAFIVHKVFTLLGM